MSANITALTAEGFLTGVFDVLDAMTNRTFSFKLNKAGAADASFLTSTLERLPLMVRGRLNRGGAVGLMFSVADAARLAALIDGKEETAAAADDQAVLAVMGEIAGPCLGAGVTHLMEKGGQTPEQPEAVSAELATPQMVADLLGFFVNPPKAVSFAYSAGTLQGAACLLLGPEIEQLAPLEALKDQANAAAAPEPDLSEAEVSDILKGFDKPGAAPARPNGSGAASPALAARAPSNLDMVLDIRLVATARLGRVEMAIGDILALGPGSIIDVGRLVDEPVELLVNNKLIARGDVVVVDEKFGLRITEIISPKERIESMH
ncbi:MAG: flagellar motor switch protein FliN [Candidatus Hydrogenedentes bacterium]|nr:flagellar motor switch protein FliN [Candidatus Hydrogenedentota bacterium]